MKAFKYLLFILVIAIVIFALVKFIPQKSNTNSVVVTGWSVATSSSLTFEYPKTFGSQNAHVVNWPPTLSVKPLPFSCPVTSQKTINGHSYCVTKRTEGTAGTSYVSYTYAFARTTSVVNIEFVVGFTDCGVYDEPKKNCV